MRVAEIMTEGVQTISPETPAEEAFELMRRESIHHLVVVSNSTVVGVVSERDIGGRAGARIRAQSRVSDLMTSDVVTTTPDATIRRIASVMRGRTIGCIPVTDGKRIVGIVTVSDLLQLLGRGIDRPARAERHALHHRVAHKHQHKAFGVW